MESIAQKGLSLLLLVSALLTNEERWSWIHLYFFRADTKGYLEAEGTVRTRERLNTGNHYFGNSN